MNETPTPPRRRWFQFSAAWENLSAAFRRSGDIEFSQMLVRCFYATLWLIAGGALAIAVVITTDVPDPSMIGGILLAFAFVTLGGVVGSLLGNSIRGAIVGGILYIALIVGGSFLLFVAFQFFGV